MLANVLSKPGNDSPSLGVHDANIIFLNRKVVDFGKQEISKLVDFGLKNIKNENVPLWYWYSLIEKSLPGFIAYRTFSIFEDDKRVGALEAMRLIGAKIKLPISVDLSRAKFIEGWFLDDTSSHVKLAALNYLKHHGEYEDLPVVQAEFDRKDYQTTRSSIETLLSIQLRNDKNEAAKVALSTQFETLDGNLIQQIVSGELAVDEEILRLGLKHRKVDIRLACVNKLNANNQLNIDDAESLANDNVASIRNAALNMLLTLDQSLMEEEIKKILVKPIAMPGFRLFSIANKRDEEGEKYYEMFLLNRYSQMDEAVLLQRIKSSSIYDELPYFALCWRYFKKYAPDLREKIDNEFKEHFENSINRMVEKYGNEQSASLVQQTRKLEEFLR